ncbi:SNF2 family domain-containing protein [Xylariaceae sp. FL1019]|nr:SNF2 family domain-containing protein [Xylariaceae sp. FL1019]
MTGTASPTQDPAHDRAELDSNPPQTTYIPDNDANPQTKKEDDAGDSDGDNHNSSIATNGHVDAAVANGNVPANASQDQPNGTHDDERPSKRRRVEETTPKKPSKKAKVESPPWKKIEADGPTTFTENGKRRSGRTNALPLDLQPQGSKRMTRGVLHGLQSSPPSKDRRAPSNHRESTTPKSAATAKTAAASRATPAKPAPPPKHNTRNSSISAPRPPPKTRRRSPSPPPQIGPPPKRSERIRRSSRTQRESLGTPAGPADTPETPNTRPTRIRLRVREPTIPVVHPAQINVIPGQTVALPKIAPSFAEYVAQAPTLDVQNGGWYDAVDDGPTYTDEMAQKDAQIILRIEAETEPGGLLSQGHSSLFVPDPVEEPPRQWARMDHLVKQMANFRKLMVMEHQRHKAAAKRLAEACKDEWTRRQPKSAEQVEAEARAACMVQYRTVIKTFQGTWENVRVEINRRRVEEWKAAEQKRIKSALNEAVSMSELKLQARQARLDSEALSDEEEENDDDSDDIDSLADSGKELDQDHMVLDSDSDSHEPELRTASDKGEDEMSSSDEEDDRKSTASDDGLTGDQLREKYANIPDLPKPTDPNPDGSNEEGGDDGLTPQANGEDDTSDESVDMDDDMTSSDEGSDDQEDDNSDEESEDGQPAGLLGLFFGKKELKKLEEEGPTEEQETMVNGTSAEDAQPPTDQADISINGATALDQSKASVQTNGTALTVEAPKGVVGQSKTEAQSISIQEGTQTQVVSSVEAPLTSAQHQTLASDTDVLMQSSQEDQNTSIPSENTPPDVETGSSVMKLDHSRSDTPHSQVLPKTEVPFLLRGTLREYQHYGLDWLAGLYMNQTNGILADEMGLGKTIQTIALLAHLASQHEVWGPHLVIVPTSVMLNWEMEFKKWCPGFKVLSYYGSIEERRRKRQGWKTDDMWNVCITSYQIVLQDQQVFKRRQWHYMILDEAHNIKNFKSKRWQTLLGFNTQARLLLTGTPLQNNLTELWSLLFFLMPSENGVGGFADLAEFQDWFHKPESQILESGREQMDDEARAIIAKLHKVLRPYLLRRLKADVEKQMPAKYEHVEFCRLSRRQRELYDGFLARTDTREALASGNYISVINCLMQLRKVCNHPDLFVERPIMTSFRQPKSVVADFESTDRLLRDKLLRISPESNVSLDFLNLIPTRHENQSATVCERVSQLSAHHVLLELRDTQKDRAQTGQSDLDPSTVESNITYLDSAGRWGRFEELQHCAYVNTLRRQQQPVYGKRLTDFLTLDTQRRPRKPRLRIPHKVMSWFEEDSAFLRTAVPSLDERAAMMKTTISKFACVTPTVVTRDMDRFVLGPRGVEEFDDMNLRLSAPIRRIPFMPKESPLDPWHEPRMRLSIQFPDKRLLQYDCGKLQALDRLLRQLQAGGHRALIFTQMTKVLDILEQFLNIHGHKYLRLDGATKVEQRQILTDRFNNDPRILCFILSTRSGGLGINLTGADTVIFYDQDWNPAMDKQCQDRCHRIGQTRDVHIYRLISEHTIEANILRKASQKQMLDDIVIQEGGFTTDHFNKLSVRDVMVDAADESDVVGDAMDRVLGGVESTDQRNVGRVLEQAEDREDVAAAHVAEQEIQEDEADFAEKPPTTSASGSSTTRQGTPTTQDGLSATAIGRSNLGLFSETAGTDEALQEIELNAWGEVVHNIDEYMLATMGKQLEDTPIELPRDKKKGKSKKGKDTRKR